MNTSIAIVICCLAASAVSQGYLDSRFQDTTDPTVDSTERTVFLPTTVETPKLYNFSYNVKDDKSKNDYGHAESSDGKVVTGSYHVLLPDGRTQIVVYKADSNGYVSEVKYEGEAQFPSTSRLSRIPVYGSA